mgnify:CR=1 FL=1
MFTINKKIDYSLVFLSNLGSQKKLVSLSEVAKKTNLPPRFLARIASLLAKNGMIKSFEGKNGGYQLADKVFKTNLYDYLLIFEKKLSFLPCYSQCRCQKSCHHKDFLQEKMDKVFINALKKIKIKDIL